MHSTLSQAEQHQSLAWILSVFPEVQSSQFHSSTMGQDLKSAWFRLSKIHLIYFNSRATQISNEVNTSATLISVSLLLEVSEETS